MPTSYTSLLGLALPVTGELSGTWGDTVNDYITQYVDAAAAGTQTISGSQTAVTLTVTNGTSLTQVGSGASGSAQYAVINCTGNPASLLTITAPASSRQYLIINATSTSQSVKIVGAGPTTGVTLVAAESAIVAWNGSDYVKVASSTVDGVSTISFGSTGLTPSTATSGAVTVAGTLAVANGGTGTSTAFTAGSVVFAGASGVYSQNNSNFFWDNSNNRLGLGVTAPTRLLHLDGGGSTTYLQMTNTASGRTDADGFQIAQDAANVEIILRENGFMSFFTNNTERGRFTAVGNFSLGGTADRGTTVGTNAIQIFNGTAPAGTLTNGVSLYSSSGDLNFMNSAGNGFRVGYRNLPPVGTQTGSYTLAAADVGKYVQIGSGGSITIPTSVFSEGDAIALYNNTTGNITITCSAPTAYIGGTNTVRTSVTLATRGVANVLFYSATACVITGNVT